MPFQNLVCPAAPLIGLLPASFLKSAHSYLYSRRPPRPPWRFSLLHIRRSRQSAEHPFPLFLSLTAFRLTFPLPVSLSLSLCPSLSLLLIHASPPFQLSQILLLCVTSLSLFLLSALADTLFRQFPSSILDPDLASAVLAATRTNYTIHIHHPPVLGLRTFLGGGDSINAR